MPPNFSAFTVRANSGGTLSSIQTDCELCLAFDPSQPSSSIPPMHSFKAIWDTGATNSVITQRVVDDCGLAPIGMTKVRGVNSIKDSEVYLINIALPNRVGFVNVRVTLNALTGADVLIGMDIITRGDVAISNVNGNTVFSFRFPSLKEVDFVHQHTEEVRRERFSHGGIKKKRKKQPKKFGKNKH